MSLSCPDVKVGTAARVSCGRIARPWDRLGLTHELLATWPIAQIEQISNDIRKLHPLGHGCDKPGALTRGNADLFIHLLHQIKALAHAVAWSCRQPIKFDLRRRVELYRSTP